MSTSFEGARTTSQTQYWDVMSEVSSDFELEDSESLKTLRLRSRQLIKDNPTAAGAQQTFINYICDAGPYITARGKGNGQTVEAQTFLDGYLPRLDITGMLSLADLDEQLVAWAFADGDILINLPLDKKRKGVQTVVELIEAHRIKTPSGLGKKYKVDESLVRHGVKYDVEGRVEGYYVKKIEHVNNFGDSPEFFDFYPMYREFNGFRRRVTWLFKAPLNARPKASRQYPILTPVITLFKYIKDYLEAVLIGARVAACFSAFVKSSNPAGTLQGMTSESGSTTYDPAGVNRNTKLQPGTITYMRTNETIDFASPNRPNDNVDSFLVRLQTQIAMTLRVPYALLFQDLKEVNYSSWRGGMLEVKRLISRWRRQIDVVNKWIINTVLFESLLRGETHGSIKDIQISMRWPSYGILDPEKQSRANKLRIQNGTASRKMIAEEEGNSFEEIQRDLLEEELLAIEKEALILKRKKELEEKYGIIFESTLEADRKTTRRPGEVEGEDLDEDDALERRKEDGNV